jgi:hypothetical protein
MTFKIVASQGERIVFDQRVEAASPREAREVMKRGLRLESLTGLVYAITEIPASLIEEIVTAKMARVTVGNGRIDPAKLMREAAEAAVQTPSTTGSCLEVSSGVGVKEAFTRSAEAFKRTWGENVVGNGGIGLVSFLGYMPDTVLPLYDGFLARNHDRAHSLNIYFITIACTGFVGAVLCVWLRKMNLRAAAAVAGAEG